MQAAPKFRVFGYLLILLMPESLLTASPADAQLARSMAAYASDGEGMPPRVPLPLSRHEVFQAIQNDLADKGIMARGNLQPEDLRIQSSLPVFQDNLGLQVKSIGFDPIRHEIVFDLWASNEPQYLPFKVTTRKDPRSLGLTQLSGLNRRGVNGRTKESVQGDFGQQVNHPRAKPPVLARPGRLATLIISGQNMRIITSVMPLQQGVRGQCIRVRDPASTRILTGEVVDEGLLRANF